MRVLIYFPILMMLLSNPRIEYFHSRAYEIAEENGIDPGVFRALIFVESAWDTTASNHMCYGLTQLKPSTASEVAGYYVSAELLISKPELAMEIGARYLKFLLDYFDGDVRAALTGYCYGPYAMQNLENPYVNKVIRVYRECYNVSWW